MTKEREELKVQSQPTPSLARVELKVNGANCCDGCRRKVLKALSIKGVLRTELHATADRVTVIGDVDGGHLVRRLAKVGKIAEVIVRPPQAEVGSKKHNGSDSKALPAIRGSGDAEHRADGKCGPKGARAAKNGVKLSDDGSGNGNATGKGQHEGARARTAFNGAAEETNDVRTTMCYHRPEPPTVVPMHLPYYTANCVMPPPPPYGIGGIYYAMPPPPHRIGGGYYAMPPPSPPHCRHPPMVRPQPTRFIDDDVFSDDNTVGCHVM